MCFMVGIMKLIIAYIQPDRLNAVKQALFGGWLLVHACLPLARFAEGAVSFACTA